MTESDSDDVPGDFHARNYCVSFIDLLGQRDAVRGQALLPSLKTEKDKRQFYEVIKKSIGSIYATQAHAEAMISHLIEGRRDSPLRAQLPEEQQRIWDEMQGTAITTQRWSDGIVSFVSLGEDGPTKCPLNGLFGVIGTAGSHVLLGLVAERPVRGAIEIAWGIELRPGELYGPATVRAYELENQVAQYPRIVIGPLVVEYLRSHLRTEGDDDFSRYNRALAELCLGLIAKDDDGYFFVDYLGTEFRLSITQSLHEELYERARVYVTKKLLEYRHQGNSKLAFRYTQLAKYFEARRPLESGGE
jgi:hypothetical protein